MTLIISKVIPYAEIMNNNERRGSQTISIRVLCAIAHALVETVHGALAARQHRARVVCCSRRRKKQESKLIRVRRL